ncbi:MAG: hypothetical protein Fur0010_05350 [Bdellovibrio sp.]
MRKEDVAALEAPFSLNNLAVGMTEHEHKGKGIPNKADLITGNNPLPLIILSKMF